MSIVTYEKPIPHVGLADWHAKQWQNQQTNDTRREDAFKLRQEARQLRNETKLCTEWSTYHNNVRLADRLTEVERWKNTLQDCVDRVNSEIEMLKQEKFSTERELDALGIPISVIAECISMRDSRLGTELTYDDGDRELKRSRLLKKMLMERCQKTWEKVNRLEEVKFKLTLDINDKEEGLQIDKEMLHLDKNCANLTFKLDPVRIVKGAVPYETWKEQSKYTKLLADSELQDTHKLREALFIARERARNDMSSQRDLVDFCLRKRVYETQKARNELEWQQKKMREEMDKVLKEIQTLNEAVLDKIDALKLCETRLENRSYRPGFELAIDEADLGLKDEDLQLRQIRADLNDKINCAKATYNALEDQMIIIDRDLANKSQSLMTDIKCLDLRIRLRTGEFAGPATNTDRNIELTRMEKEIPPT